MTINIRRNALRLLRPTRAALASLLKTDGAKRERGMVHYLY